MTNSSKDSLLNIVRAEDGGADGAPEALNLGQRVRDLRKEKNWTLEQAAKKAGLARSTLSKIENELMSPTFDAVKKLAEGLEISIPQLFTAPKSDTALARLAVGRAGEGKTVTTATYEHELLAASLSKKSMMPYRARIRARSFEEFEGWVRHDGEEFLFVLSGIVMFYTEHYAPVEMRRGDSAYYDATMGHNVTSVSDEDAVVLWVTSL